MKLYKNALSKCILGLLILSFQAGVSQTAPNIEWQKSYWAETYPTSPQQPTIPLLPAPLPANGLQGVIPQNLTSEDWFYTHQLSKGTDGKPDGYICGGYSGFINYAEMDRYGCGRFFLGGVDCNELETPGYQKGVNKSIICKVDLAGNKIWYKVYTNGTICNIIQTSDGGYLALSASESTEDGHGNLIAYNPSLGDTTDYFTFAAIQPTANNGHLELIKVDAMGNVQWEYLYGMEPYVGTGTVAFNQKSSNTGGSGGGGLIETSQGDFLLTGYADDRLNSNTSRTCVIKVDKKGMWKWGKFYGSTQFTGIGTAIKGIGTGANQQFFVSNFEYLGPLNPVKGNVYKIDNVGNLLWNNPISITGTLDGARVGASLDINSAGELLVPNFRDIIGNGAPGERAHGFVNRYNNLSDPSGNTPTLISETQLGDIVAYDLTVGVVATADGGFAVVSSKRPGPNGSMDGGNAIPAYWPNVSNNSTTPICDYTGYWSERAHRECGASDGYVGKFDAFGNMQWEKIFDGNTNRPQGAESSWIYPDFPNNRDIRRQECLYSIVQSPDGGFVVAGNNSENFDDCYLVKLESTCTHVVLSNITLPASGSPQSFMYQATDYISAANVTLVPPSNLDLRAGNEIRLLPDFTIPSGSGEFSAVIDPYLDCTPNGRRSSQNANSNHIISSTDDIKKINADELNIFPNPNNGIFTVNFSDNSVKSIYVYNMLGEVVFSKIAFTDQQINVNITEKNNGIYIVKTIEGNSMKTKKIIRQ